MFILELRNLFWEELLVDCIHNIEKELTVNELVSVRIVIWKVLDNCRHLRDFLVNIAHTELTVARNTYSFDLIVREILLATCKELLQEVKFARALVRQVYLTCGANR